MIFNIIILKEYSIVFYVRKTIAYDEIDETEKPWKKWGMERKTHQAGSLLRLNIVI
jgi:hypothetical protein